MPLRGQKVRPDITQDAIADAIDQYRGNITAVANHFGVHRQTIYDRMAEFPDLKNNLRSARETMIDNVESKLYQQALAGDKTCMIFFLKTQGKHRGWVERTEMVGADDAPPVQKIIFGAPEPSKNGSGR